MTTTQDSFDDQWDNMVTIRCPRGHVVARRRAEDVEGRDELVNVRCEECRERFDWPVRPKEGRA
jgi:hypothetical protein